MFGLRPTVADNANDFSGDFFYRQNHLTAAAKRILAR